MTCTIFGIMMDYVHWTPEMVMERERERVSHVMSMSSEECWLIFLSISSCWRFYPTSIVQSQVLPSLLEEDTDEPEHEGEAFYNDLFHVSLGPKGKPTADDSGMFPRIPNDSRGIKKNDGRGRSTGPGPEFWRNKWSEDTHSSGRNVQQVSEMYHAHTNTYTVYIYYMYNVVYIYICVIYR